MAGYIQYVTLNVSGFVVLYLIIVIPLWMNEFTGCINFVQLRNVSFIGTGAIVGLPRWSNNERERCRWN